MKDKDKDEGIYSKLIPYFHILSAKLAQLVERWSYEQTQSEPTARGSNPRFSIIFFLFFFYLLCGV
jgi:hypothetical protein